jgi:hypothetical protein
MKTRVLMGIFMSLLAALLVTRIVFAHGHTMVGDYELVIGFHNEPAIQGEPNGLDLFVTNSKTKEKVNKLEATLKAEIIFGSSKRQVEVKPQWGVDGAYTAYVLPTEAGDYTWHIFGSINSTPVDVSMTSSEQTFGAVIARSEYSFPEVELSTSELKASSNSASSTALYVGLGGVILGIAGVVLGFVAMRKR